MQLRTLLEAVPDKIAITSSEEVDVTGPIVEDSRAVVPGALFVARAGLIVDGHDFIGQVVESGAAAVVGERSVFEVECAVPYVQVADSALALAYLSAAKEGFPARKLTMIGITGTDGKTTTSNLLYSILKNAGIQAGMISTINAVLGASQQDTGLHVTTPTAPEVQKYLAQMVEAGLTHCILEATSHGLAQHRVAACDFDTAIVTNIQHEHLDFHGSWENYRDAKAMLFEALTTAYRKADVPKIAVINQDDDRSAGHLLAIPADQHITYHLGDEDGAATVQAVAVDYGPDRTMIAIRLPEDDTLYIESQLVGRFNVSNVLAAVAAACGMGIDRQAIKAGIEAVEGVSGRMERIDEGQPFLALVDFAHTPNALRGALEAARMMVGSQQRVIAVFGSAGLRDPEKRSLMGTIAAELADLTIITAEDPRTESLDDILAQSAAAMTAAGGIEGETFWRVPDRGEALLRACQIAQVGDVVLACGKGHEQSMAFGTTEYPWDDRDALRSALQGRALATLPTASQPGD